MEEDVTVKILDRGVKVSRSEILRRLKRANLMRYGYKREISTNRRIENNTSEFKVSPAVCFSLKRFIAFMALCPLIQIKFRDRSLFTVGGRATIFSKSGWKKI